MDFALDQADKIASVAGAVIAAIALTVTVRQARDQRRGGDGQGSGSRPPVWMIAGLAVVASCALGSWGMISVVSKWADDSGDDPSAGPVIATGGATAPAGPAAPSGGAAGPAGTDAAPVLWKDEVRLDSTPRDFDVEPPERDPDRLFTADGYFNGSEYQKMSGSAFAPWTAKSAPSRDDCAARLETHGAGEVKVDSGSRFCMHTSEERVVFIKVLRRDNKGLLAEVTLWGSN